MTVSPLVIYVMSVGDDVRFAFAFLGTLIAFFCCVGTIYAWSNFGRVSNRILVGIVVGISLLLLAAFVPSSETLSAMISASQGVICEEVRK